MALLLQWGCSAYPVHAATVTGNTITAVGDPTVAYVRFLPRSTPIAYGTNTVLGYPVRASVDTNNNFSAKLVGGFYDTYFGNETVIPPLRILVPLNDTNTYTLNQVAQLAVNAGMFGMTNIVIISSVAGISNNTVAQLPSAIWTSQSGLPGAWTQNLAITNTAADLITSLPGGRQWLGTPVWWSAEYPANTFAATYKTGSATNWGIFEIDVRDVIVSGGLTNTGFYLSTTLTGATYNLSALVNVTTIYHYGDGSGLTNLNLAVDGSALQNVRATALSLDLNYQFDISDVSVTATNGIIDFSGFTSGFKAVKFIGSGAGLTGILPAAISGGFTGTVTNWGVSAYSNRVYYFNGIVTNVTRP